MKRTCVDYMGYLVGAYLIALLISLPFLVYYDTARSNRLMQQCTADGHAEYYCRALIVR